MYSVSIGHGMIYSSNDITIEPYVFLQEYSKTKDKQKAIEASKYAYYEKKVVNILKK